MKNAATLAILLFLNSFTGIAQNASRLVYALRGTYSNGNPRVTDSVQFYNPLNMGAGFSCSMAKELEQSVLGATNFYNSNIQLFPVDSFYCYTNLKPQPLTLMVANAFNSKGQMSKAEFIRTAAPAYYYNYTYNGDQLALREYFYQDMATGQFNNTMRWTYTYSSGNLSLLTYEQSSSGLWETTSSTKYYYSNGYLDSAVTTSISPVQYYYTYNANHALVSLKTVNTGGSTTDVTYTYNASNDLASMITFNDGIPYSKEEYTYDNAHNCIAITTYVGSATAPNFKYLVTYNSFNQVTEFASRKWDAQNAQWVIDENTTNPSLGSRFNKFVYESYTLPAAVSHINEQADIKLYPSPAGDFIRIAATWKQPEAATAAIYDMSGHIIQQWAEAVAQQYDRTIPTAHLPSGNYFIQINTGKEKVTRQFTVAH